MKKAKSILCILLVLFMAVSLLACGSTSTGNDSGNSTSGDSGSDDSGSGAALKTITMGVSGYLGRFLPGGSPAETLSGCDGVYDTVVYLDIETKEYVSDVLEDWYWEDPTTLIMKLKDGVIFSNGDKATSEDLLFSFQQYFLRSTGALTGTGMLIDECITLDEFTVSLKFAREYNYKPGVYLMNKSWSESVGWDSEEWYTPVASGPYYVDEYVADDHFTLKLRDEYWLRDISDYAVETYIVEYYPDPSSMYMDLELGNIDICQVMTTDYARFEEDGGDGFNCEIINMGVTCYFAMDFKNQPLFADKAVREALAYGVKWDEVGMSDKGVMYIPSTSVVSATSPYHIDLPAYEYNPEKAKQILEDAGYADGDIEIYLYLMEVDSFKNMSQVLQFYCDQIGIKINIEFGDVASALAVWETDGGSDAGFEEMIFVAPDGDPYMNLGITLAGANAFKWCMVDDDKYQELLSDGIYNSDEASREAIFKEFQQYVHDEMLLLPISEATSAIGYRTEIFSEKQINGYVHSYNYYQICNLGLKEAWE